MSRTILASLLCLHAMVSATLAQDETTPALPAAPAAPAFAPVPAGVAVQATPSSLTPAPGPWLTIATKRFGSFDLVTIDAQGGNARRIGGLSGVAEPCWSPDGSQVAYTGFTGPASQIYVAQADGSGPRRLTDTNVSERNPIWSPDGKQLVFTSDRAGNPEIFVMQADGTSVRNLTNHDSFDADPAWSPDGQRIAFASNRSGQFRVWVMSADGSNPVDLLNRDQAGCIYPSWSPDGQQLVFGGRADDGSVQLFVANANGGGLQQITQTPFLNSYAAWSPDGRSIAYVHFGNWPNQNQPLDPNVAGGDLMMYDLVNNTHVQVAAGDVSPYGARSTWRPDW